MKGFTLIELMVVVTLIAIIGLITSQMFILNVRSQSKSEIQQEVKQSGDYAISVIESMVRNAVDIEKGSCNQNTDQIAITNQDGFSTQFLCDDGNKRIASVSSFPDPLPTVSVPLLSEKVVVSQCSFRVVCPTPPLSPKYVFINFSVSQENPDAGVNASALLEYQTTIAVRNYQ